MGATLDDARATMEKLGGAGTPTHPGKQARLAAITNGWVAAEELEQGGPSDEPASSDPIPQTTHTTPDPGGPPPTEPAAPQYVARAVFAGDMNAYFLTSQDEIVGVTPTGQSMLVGRRTPPTWPNFVWMYQTAYVTYGVSADGRIWSRNALGQMLQVGYVTGVR